MNKHTNKSNNCYSTYYQKKEMPKSRESSGLTLLEILVVVAILAVIAAIGLPAIQSMLRNGATASDTTNLRQIGIAIQTYANENDGFIPNESRAIPNTRAGGTPPTAPNRWNFQEAVDRYLGNNYLQNPSSIYNYARNEVWYSRFADPYPGFNPSASLQQARPIAYGFNPYINDSNWMGRLMAIPKPSEIVVMGELNDLFSAPWDRPRLQIDVNQRPVTVGNQATRYRVNRNGRALYLFCDGHVASLEGDQSEPTLQAAGKPNIWRWW